MKGGLFIKEYAILCIYGRGRPFYIQPYFSLEDAKTTLYDMVNLEIERNRAYYVDNDFFENVFPNGIQNSKYFCIKERTVSNWETVSKFKQNKNNIIYFNKIR